MDSRYAVDVTAPALAEAAKYAAHRNREARVAALLDRQGPLTADERQLLESSLLWWQAQYVTAESRARAIRDRLDGQ